MTIRAKEAGFTITELIVAISISMILAAALIGFMVSWLQGYALASVRNTLMTNNRRALNIFGDDVRSASNAVGYNQWADNNAPSVADPSGAVGPSPDTDYHFYWRSSAHQLILIRPARDSSGNAIYDDPVQFIGGKDNYIYYVDTSSRTLNRRIIPAPYAQNSLSVISCTSIATGGCPGQDFKIADNVKINADGAPGFTIAYYNNVGQLIDYNSATSVRSVVVTLDLTTTQNNQNVTVSDSLRMVFRNN